MSIYKNDIDYDNLSKEILLYIIKNKNSNTEELLISIIKKILEKDGWLRIYELFNELFDELYYDIILKKIKLEKKVIKIIEVFAMPLYSRTDLEQKKVFKKYLS